MTGDAREFLNIVRDYSRQGPGGRTNRIGIVDTVQGQSARIRFDGESIAGLRYYPALGSYLPVTGDRVLLLPVGSITSYVIIGSLPT